ncbi:proteobacterial dedicated sortase system histidine kinase [Colwellia sp. 1_MG-2023]|uniref:proteobacterial dedicated sortase system histidine kinase n=1 Tax=Colwellia sp. 1_MG-2023 TaxID=3062649 RepID=UPI0026E46706|nr:proteobacterial dedicated sortase system histidine kinase [Colwellia sp. 1_MG-2023]MDO6447285.1 proteobacterial dedicated sortase system histidine kinase [Colwellia sp. 1_MG-2023]
MQFRFGLRSKLLLLSSFLVAIPWFGYQYVWEMEKYLRFGQEQTIIGTARALATALHERPNLFNNQASFLPSVEKGKDLYGYQLNHPINLDGSHQDWPNYLAKSHYYGVDNQLTNNQNTLPLTIEKLSNNYTAAVGKYDKYLYFFVSVVDDNVIYRDNNARSIELNDRLELAFTTPQGRFQRYLVANKHAGWLDVFQIQDDEIIPPTPALFIQGKWLETPQGYNIEFRIPLKNISDNLAFSIHDVDEPFGQTKSTIASANTTNKDSLGTILVPSPEIERIVKGMSYTNSSVWVVDQHHRVLAKAGDIQAANGLWQKNSINQEDSWRTELQALLKPLFKRLLTQPPKAFIDQLYDAQNLTGKHIESALQGIPQSQWRLSSDNKAVILTAAYPIYFGNKVHGAVIVEETNNGIRTVRNQALEKLFTSILAIMIFGIMAFFFFASRISNRIRALRNQAEQAIDEHGRINEAMTASTKNDEIGDLSRSFSTAVSRLSQYNHYLENMSSRLSHELRTPIAVVRTSLENLTIQNQHSPHSNAYIERAQQGLNRLNLILTNMSEATRLEQMLKNTDCITFNFYQVLNGCLQGYRQIYENYHFQTNFSDEKVTMNGSPEHIAQLLDKVISNAVEFSEDKKITLAIEQQSNSLTLHISNNGRYLPEEMTERLFDSMISIRDNHQDLNELTAENKRPHLGLGLYMARLICQFHQGNIQASNHHNPKGVTITIILPIQNN